MTLPIMKKATALWLVDNTTLTFRQIAEFCGLHELEIKSIADGEVATNMIPEDPIQKGIVLKEELDRAIKDPNHKLELASDFINYIKEQKKKSSKYTPIARRNDKPDAVMWFEKNHPKVTESQIIRLIGTTKKTIQAVKDREHWNIKNIKPRDPVLLGLCTQTDLEKVLAKYREEKTA
jgi:hypothetical protein